MSIDINWERSTSGPDGEALAERIRSFIHEKFQQVTLPRFIRSVEVHSFDFGTVPPELELKDFCDPFADFYDEDGMSDTSEELPVEQRSQWYGHSDSQDHSYSEDQDIDQQPQIHAGHDIHPFDLRSPVDFGEHLNSHFLPRAGTPGIPGGTSNLGCHLMSLGGLSGAQTPLAAVAGGSPFANRWPESMLDHRPGFRRRGVQGGVDNGRRQPSEAEAENSLPSQPSTANAMPVPSGGRSSMKSTRNKPPGEFSEHNASVSVHQEAHTHSSFVTQPFQSPRRVRERTPEDFQVICRVKYAGDVKLSLTAEILLDYPMPSFVGLPLKLNITGLAFDGVAVLAYIRRRAHFCFLSPEDADTVVGSDHQEGTSAAGDYDTNNRHTDSNPPSSGHRLAPKKQADSLLQQIRVESEIGRKENGKQALKNVGKVERFILDQVRRIFEEEFVFPSSWTFLL
jgi:distribution and morphology protein 12